MSSILLLAHLATEEPEEPTVTTRLARRFGWPDWGWRAMVGGALAALLGAFVMVVGWIGGLEWALSVIPGAVTMKANTALGFIVAGSAVALVGSWLRVLSVALSTALVGFGLWALGAHASDLVPVASLVGESVELARHTERPGLMAVPTALCFTLCGASCLALETKLLAWPAFLCSAVSTVVSLSCIILYFTGHPAPLAGDGGTAMAVHTAVGFMLLSWAEFSRATEVISA